MEADVLVRADLVPDSLVVAVELRLAVADVLVDFVCLVL